MPQSVSLAQYIRRVPSAVIALVLVEVPLFARAQGPPPISLSIASSCSAPAWPSSSTPATFSIDLTQNATFADLLNQIRGEQIELDAPSKIIGTILGVEKRQLPTGQEDKTVESPDLKILIAKALTIDAVGPGAPQKGQDKCEPPASRLRRLI